VRIEAANHLVMNGEIRADAGSADSTRGGGAGGGVYLTCKTFDGTGKITARGGNVYSSNAGGGGGGRIAIVWSDTEAQKAYSPAPILHTGARCYGKSDGCYPTPDRMPAYRALRNWSGTPGTVYLTDDSFYPGTIWAKCSGWFSFGTRTKNSYVLDGDLFAAESSGDAAMLAQEVCFHDVTLSFPNGLTLPKYAHIIASNCTLNASSVSLDSGCLEVFGHSIVEVSGDLTATGTAQLNFEAGATNGIGAATWNPWGQLVTVGGKLKLADAAILYPGSDNLNGGSVNFTLGSLEIAAGAAIKGNSRGWGRVSHVIVGPGNGPGANPYSNIDGAAHGGYGGTPRANDPNNRTYGDERHPTMPGSSGGRSSAAGYIGGWGGGLFHATVARTVQLDGTINMNGSDCYGAESGGGSGGSVYIKCDRLAGGGTITANGGHGGSTPAYSGNGGGGRIAVYCSKAASWKGMLTAAAGSCATVYAQPAGDGSTFYKQSGGLQILLR